MPEIPFDTQNFSAVKFPVRGMTYYEPHFKRSRDSVFSTVSTETGYGLDDRGVRVRVPVGSRIFSSPRLSHRF
jgi:hypothetical protein